MRSLVLALLVLVLWAAPALADAPKDDPIGSRLFPPELIMSNQQALGIDDKQRQAIMAEVQKAQGQILEVQWKMQAAVEELVKLLDEPRIDEAKAIAAADKVMGLEREVKRTHLGLLIRIRNVLTPEQRVKLAALRAKGP